MLIAWHYRERDTVIQRLDPRARIIWTLAFLFSIIQFWDLRIMLLFLAVAVIQFKLAKLTWRETRRVWILVSFIIFFMTTLTFLTGRGGVATAYHEEHLINRLGPLSLPIFGWQGFTKLTPAEMTMKRSLSILLSLIISKISIPKRK